jgi:pyrroline-5-carboxylate reductase
MTAPAQSLISEKVKSGTATLGVIGAGVMGQALIEGLINKKVFQASQIWAAAKTESSCEKVKAKLGVDSYTDYRSILPETDVILLCVKPSQVEKVFGTLVKANLRPDTLIISIVAGMTLGMMEGHLKALNHASESAQTNPVIRAMTNTPCIVGQGMTAICGGTSVSKEEMALAQRVFDSVGICLELEEHHFDAITGMSGSGPAYMFLIMEALADGGVRVGLPREVALKVVSQTVLGAATMVQKTGRHPAALRDDVTTPAGCTIGALLVMEDGKIRSVLARAVEEATRIAGQLGQKKT